MPLYVSRNATENKKGNKMVNFVLKISLHNNINCLIFDLGLNICI